jgi:hypothetical protein
VDGIVINIPIQQLNSFEILKPNKMETRLVNGKNIIMSNRKTESDEHAVFFNQPLKGNVLVTGLGIGFVNEYLIKVPEIEKVVIVEKYQEVIDMVWPYCKRDDRFEIVHADADTWTPTMLFDYAWIDHWTELHEITQEEWWVFIEDKYSQHSNWVGIWYKDKGENRC